MFFKFLIPIIQNIVLINANREYCQQQHLKKVIWSNQVTEGFFQKRVVETQMITNYRIVQNSAYVGLGLLEDVVVMNQRRESQSNYTSVGGGRYTPRIGSGTSKSRTVGDIVFIYQGEPFIIFRQIYDPQGVARLAKAARKTYIENQKRAQKIEKAQLKEQERRRRVQQQHHHQKAISNKGITCPHCSSTSNAEGSKYCSNCGFRFADAVISEGEAITKNQRPLPSSSSSSHSSSLTKTTEQDNNIIVDKFVTYVSLTHGVRINYPSNWLKIEQGLKGNVFVLFKSPKEDASDILLESIAIGSFNVPKIKLDQFMIGVMNNLKMDWIRIIHYTDIVDKDHYFLSCKTLCSITFLFIRVYCTMVYANSCCLEKICL